MKCLKVVFLFFVLTVVLTHGTETRAAVKTVNGVPYIHQVLDMETSKFYGHNACGPTSAVMITEFYKFHPNMSQFPGTYVYSPYSGFTDKSGFNYYKTSINYPGVGDGPYDMTVNEQHINEVEDGAHGYMIYKYPCSGGYCWGTNEGGLIEYLENHGLTVNVFYGTNESRFEKIKQNIDSGLPLIGHFPGHYFVIVGYDTGPSGTEQKIIVHDPYGNKNNIWNGSTRGEGITYGFPYVSNAGNIDRVHTIHPVGIYNQFPGFHIDGTS